MGCVGEFVAEFTHLPKGKDAEQMLARLSLLVLIVGIAGELLGTVRTSQLSGRLIAGIEERAGNAEQKAGEANERAAGLTKKAEDERVARVQIEEGLAGRKLSPKDTKTLIDRLTRFRGEQPVIPAYAVGDAEAAAFTWDIARALYAAKWAIFSPSSVVRLARAGVPFESGVANLTTGVEISSTDSGRIAAKALFKVLSDCGFDAHLTPTLEPARDGKRIDVFVTTRPRGPQGEAKLRQHPLSAE
jgi:hypothetical protein